LSHDHLPLWVIRTSAASNNISRNWRLSPAVTGHGGVLASFNP
jgi:hypothetical protein